MDSTIEADLSEGVKEKSSKDVKALREKLAQPNILLIKLRGRIKMCASANKVRGIGGMFQVLNKKLLGCAMDRVCHFIAFCTTKTLGRWEAIPFLFVYGQIFFKLDRQHISQLTTAPLIILFYAFNGT